MVEVALLGYELQNLGGVAKSQNDLTFPPFSDKIMACNLMGEMDRQGEFLHE